mmetsp:Transcript_6201/g.9673  ORF Transcript_6201/g.9673 Transcript_6201/m.9673 type:complete len:417 (+) Transcript_6201:148-1398(+)
MVLPSFSRSTVTVTSPSGQRAIAIALFCAWLIFRLIFSSTSSSVLNVNTPGETVIIKDTSGKSISISGASSALELEEAISQSAPNFIAIQQNNNQAIPTVTTKQEAPKSPQQLPQQQPQRQYKKLTKTKGAGTVQHGATLEHPSLRNKMRRYREVKRDELAPKAEVLPHHFQQYVDGIKYVEVDSGRDDVKRYAAVIKSKQPSSSKNESDNYEAVTIRAWMTIVYSGNPIGNQAAAELSKVIASSPYDSVLFETPGCNWINSAIKPFEFALVNEPNLKVFAESNPDRHAFEEYFTSQSCSSSENDGGSDQIEIAVCAFPNLGKDATLISPLPQSGINDATYSHLASFIRNAPQEQVTQFWKLSAKEFIEELKHKHERINEYAGTWFSTNGMGVAWLHLRIDSLPKYFSYAPFTKPV